MVPWTAGKNCGYQVFFLNFKDFISRFDFQNVYVKPNWPNFSNFWTQKKQMINIFAKTFAHIKNKYYRKNLCIYKKQIRKQKIFAIPLCLFMEQDLELFFVFQP